MVSTRLESEVSQTINLLTTTTGLIDIHIVHAVGEPAWLIPQSLVLDVLPVPSDSETLVWNGQQLPILSLLGQQKVGVRTVSAVVVEAESDQQRFVLLSQQEPDSQRVRISGLHDEDQADHGLQYCFQLVRLEGGHYQIPDLDQVSRQLAQ
jgi:hypothetical protein